MTKMLKQVKSKENAEPKFSMRLKKKPDLKENSSNLKKKLSSLKKSIDAKESKPQNSNIKNKDKKNNEDTTVVKTKALKRKRQEDQPKNTENVKKPIAQDKVHLVKVDKQKEAQKQRQKKRLNKKGIEEQIKEGLHEQNKQEEEQEESNEEEEVKVKDGKAKKGKYVNLKTVTSKDKPSTEHCPEKDLSKSHVLQCISAIYHLTEEQLKDKNELFDGEHQPVFLQVTCVRVPRTPRRQIRFMLPHPIISPDDDVALIVPDIQRGRRKDPQPAIDHYEELLTNYNCNGLIKTVIPLNQIRTEYDQYELKRRLANTYDHFLVDARISGHIAHLLGKQFYKRRKIPIPIRTNWKNPNFNLKNEILRAQRKSGLFVHSFGDTHACRVGNTGMKAEDVAENLIAACIEIGKNYPGGWANVRAVWVKTEKSVGVPVYVTLKSKNSVAIPVVKPRRPKAYRTIRGELTTLQRPGQVVVTPEGSVSVKLPRKGKLKSKKVDKTTEDTTE